MMAAFLCAENACRSRRSQLEAQRRAVADIPADGAVFVADFEILGYTLRKGRNYLWLFFKLKKRYYMKTRK